MDRPQWLEIGDEDDLVGNIFQTVELRENDMSRDLMRAERSLQKNAALNCHAFLSVMTLPYTSLHICSSPFPSAPRTSPYLTPASPPIHHDCH